MSTSTLTITEPCFVYDMPASVYHADPCETPSLSSSVARTILGKSLAHAYAEHPKLGGRRKESTASMDRGSLVHALLAGTASAEVEVGDFTTFRSKAAQEWEQSVRERGKIAALERDWDEAHTIAAAVRAKASRGLTLDPFATPTAHAEVSAFWQRNNTTNNSGCWMRARFDRLVNPGDEPCTAWDWKVTSDISPAAVKRAIRRFGYHHQAAHYLAGLDALVPQFRGRHSFVFVFVEDAAPYSVRRYCLRPDTLQCAAIDIGRAHDAWEQALRTDEWPDGTSERTTFIDVPSFDDADDEIHTAAA